MLSGATSLAGFLVSTYGRIEVPAEGFRAVRKEMATKQELGEVRASITELRPDTTMITEVMVSKADLSNAFRHEIDAAPFAKASEVKDLAHASR